jgi:DNA-binding response OmpR family regulator
MPRIICIDPDPHRVEEPVKVLRSDGYEVMLAFSPEVGMALVRLFPPDLVLLDSSLSDQLMPQLLQACPSVPVVVTGEKPLSVEELELLASNQHTALAAHQRPHLTH